MKNPFKIVIISQNSFPKLCPRSHRTTELAKELARRGHQVIVYALLGNYDYSEFSDKTNIVFKNLGKSKLGVGNNIDTGERNIIYKCINKIFSKCIVFPEIELIPMVKKAISKEENIDLLITIAHPHTIHYGASISSLANVSVWIADCGDPFMGNPFIKYPKYFSRLERKWCAKCDFISVPIEEAKNGYYEEFQNKIRVIPQGFDHSSIVLQDYKANKIPTFAYSGVVYPNLRDPSNFLEYLSGLDIEFKFIVYTKSIWAFTPYLAVLKDKLEIRDYVPREQLLFNLSGVDFLINIINNSGVQQPSKLIDYVLTNRPILNISSSFNSEEKEHFEEFLIKNYSSKINKSIDVSKYDIKNIADSFLDFVNKIN